MNKTVLPLLCSLAMLTGRVLAAGFPSYTLLPPSLEPQFTATNCVDIAADETNLYVLSSLGKVFVFDEDGRLLSSFGSSGTQDGKLNNPQGIAVYGDEVYVSDYGNNRVQVFGKNGTFARKWGGPSSGSGTNQFNSPKGCSVFDGRVYVADCANNRIMVFGTNGNYRMQWGQYGTLPGQFQYPARVQAVNGRVYVLEDWPGDLAKGGPMVQVFTADGVYLRRLTAYVYSYSGGNTCLASDGAHVFVGSSGVETGAGNDARFTAYDLGGRELYSYRNRFGGIANKTFPLSDPPLTYPAGMAVRSPFVYVADMYTHRIVRFRRVFRSVASPGLWDRPIPRALVISNAARAGTGVLDVDYHVVDSVSPTVTVYAAAFTGTTNVLATLVPMRTFVEGTGANLGPGITVGVTNRLSWDASADWNQDYGYLRVAFFVRDPARKVLDIHYLELPGLNGHAPVTISRTGLTQDDLLTIWFWLIAANDAAIRFQDGAVYGVGGSYDGKLLANSSGTTADGRAFLFSWLGVREATSDELQYAREGTTPGSIEQWTPRLQIDGRPVKVNEFSFETGFTNGWWVVKE